MTLNFDSTYPSRRAYVLKVRSDAKVDALARCRVDRQSDAAARSSESLARNTRPDEIESPAARDPSVMHLDPDDTQRLPWTIRLTARRRLAMVVALGVIVYSVGPAVVPVANRLLVTWNAVCLTYLTLYWLTITRADADLTRRSAGSYDQTAYIILLLVTTAACASVVAIGFVMRDVKSLTFWPKALHLGLSIAALVLSWMLIHTVFAFHYARRYYAAASLEGPAAGLKFPGVDEPDYFDFAYHSFVVGMTSQVSDVSATTAQMRRTTLAHSVLSFLFNMAVLAMSINVISGAI